MTGQTLTPFEEVGTRRAGVHAGGKRQRYVLSEQGRRLLLDRYDGRSATLDDLMAHFPGVPRHRVRQWAQQLGLARKREDRWSTADVAYLEGHLYKQSVADIAAHLGRTRTAVKLKAKRLGVNKEQQEGYTMRGLCLGLGCDHHAVARWLAAGWLHGARRHTERTAHLDTWLFTDADVRRFVRAHPGEVDPRRADWLWLVDVLTGGDNGLGELAHPRMNGGRAAVVSQS